MNIYEDESLEQKLEGLSDQLGLLLLDLLIAGIHSVRRENHILQDFSEAKAQARTQTAPF